MAWNTTWSTADEIDFQNRLIEAGKVKQLRGLRQAYRFRDWDGPGMLVNKMVVERHLDNYLAKITPSPKPFKSWALRHAAVRDEGNPE